VITPVELFIEILSPPVVLFVSQVISVPEEIVCALDWVNSTHAQEAFLTAK
jgi:hypothetical protein